MSTINTFASNDSGASILSSLNTNFSNLNTDKIGGADVVTVDSDIGQVEIGESTNITGDGRYILGIGGTVNDFLDIYLKNHSDGDSAFTDISVGADNDGTSLIGKYIDMGVAGSGFLAASLGSVYTVTIDTAGTGYSIGDRLNINAGDNNAEVTVLTLTGSGVATASVSINGTGYVVASAITTTPVTGTGSGCKVNITALIDNSLIVANDGYLYTSGGNQLVGTSDAGYVVKVHTGGHGTTNLRLTIDDSYSTYTNVIKPKQATTAGAPTYIKGGIYFDTTLNKLRVGGASGWETITSS